MEDEIQKVCNEINNAFSSIGVAVEEFANALGRLCNAYPSLDDVFGKDEERELVKGDYCFWSKDESSGFGHVIGIGIKTITIYTTDKKYVSVQKTEAWYWKEMP